METIKLFESGKNKLKEGKYLEALTTFEEILEKDPHNIEATLEKGKALFGLGRYHDSIHAFDEILKETPKHVKAMMQKGKALIHLEDFDNALNCFDSIINSGTSNNNEKAESCVRKGNILEKKGALPRSIINLYDQALEYDPIHISAFHLKKMKLGEINQEDEIAEMPETVTDLYNEAIKKSPESANIYYKKVLHLLKNCNRSDKESNEKKESIEIFQNAIKSYPNNPDFYYHYGLLLRQLGENNHAKEVFEKALTLAPENTKIQKQLQNSKLESMENNDNTDNIYTFLKSLELSESDGRKIDLLQKIGKYYFEKKDYSNTIIQLNKALELSPRESTRLEILKSIINAYERRKGQLLSPKHQTERLSDNKLNEEISNIQSKLKEIYIEILAIDKNNIFALHGKGKLTSEIGNKSEAIFIYKKVIQKDPKNILAYKRLAKIYTDSNRYDKAINTYKAILNFEDKDVSAYLSIGRLQTELREYQDALENYNTALEKIGEKAEFYLNRGIVQYKMKLLDDALNSFDKALSINPKLADAYFRKGIHFREIGDDNSAIKSLNQSIKLNPKATTPYQLKGRILGKQGKIKEALSCLEQAIKVNPHNDISYYLKAKILHTNGEKEEALDALRNWEETYYGKNGLILGEKYLILEELGDEIGLDTIAKNISRIEKFEKSFYIYYFVGRYYFEKGNDGSNEDNKNEKIQYYETALILLKSSYEDMKIDNKGYMHTERYQKSTLILIVVSYNRLYDLYIHDKEKQKKLIAIYSEYEKELKNDKKHFDTFHHIINNKLPLNRYEITRLFIESLFKLHDFYFYSDFFLSDIGKHILDNLKKHTGTFISFMERYTKKDINFYFLKYIWILLRCIDNKSDFIEKNTKSYTEYDRKLLGNPIRGVSFHGISQKQLFVELLEILLHLFHKRKIKYLLTPQLNSENFFEEIEKYILESSESRVKNVLLHLINNKKYPAIARPESIKSIIEKIGKKQYQEKTRFEDYKEVETEFVASINEYNQDKYEIKNLREFKNSNSPFEFTQKIIEIWSDHPDYEKLRKEYEYNNNEQIDYLGFLKDKGISNLEIENILVYFQGTECILTNLDDKIDSNSGIPLPEKHGFQKDVPSILTTDEFISKFSQEFIPYFTQSIREVIQGVFVNQPSEKNTMKIKLKEIPKRSFHKLEINEEVFNTIQGLDEAILEFDIKNILLSLFSKNFAILTGPSGKGKTHTIRLLAKILYSDNYGTYFKHVAVKPNRTDNTDLLGWFNPVSGEYFEGEINSFFKNAYQDPTNMYILLLDEINLARVEYYMVNFLSYFDEMNEKTGESDFIRLFSLDEEQPKDKCKKIQQMIETSFLYYKTDSTYEIGYKIPANLFIIGTANIDEASYNFSDKVLDRCNIIEIGTIKGELIVENLKYELKTKISEKNELVEGYEIFERIIKELENLLPIGHRIRKEGKRYLKLSGTTNLNIAIDLLILQRILPKIKGEYEEISKELDTIRESLFSQGFKNSASKISYMLKKGERKGYISFF